MEHLKGVKLSGGVTNGRCEDVLAIWSVSVGQPITDEEYDAAPADPLVRKLAAYSDPQLRQALSQAVAVVGSRPSWRDWLDVLEQVQRVSSVVGPGSRVVADTALPSRLRATELLEARRARFLQDAGSIPFDQATVDDAFEVLRTRIGEAEATRHLLKRRAPRWRVAPSRQLKGAPIVDTSEIELAIVAILSATTNPWQFSSTPDGRMFTGTRLGYHKEEERTYVAGLSDVLDTTASVIESHRAGLGGRVYLQRQVVECAECKLVMAWLGNAGSRATVFGRCTAVAKRK